MQISFIQIPNLSTFSIRDQVKKALTLFIPHQDENSIKQCSKQSDDPHVSLFFQFIKNVVAIILYYYDYVFAG